MTYKVTMKWLTSGVILVCMLLQLASHASAKKIYKRVKGNKNWRMAKCKKWMSPMQEEISELQKTVDTISNPVHIHLHTASASDVMFTASADTVMADGTESEQAKDHSHRDHHHQHHHKARSGERHHGRPRGGKSRGKHRHDASRGSEEEQDSSQESSEEEEEGEEEEEEGGSRQSHVHIHLNIAANSQGKQGQGHGEGHECTADSGYPKNTYIYATCDMRPNTATSTRHNVRGAVSLRQKPNEPLEVKVNLYGFNTRAAAARGRTENKHHHGFHVHMYGDYQSGCNSFGGHFNPGGHAHGGPESEHKHAGDWGNIEANTSGVVITTFNQTGVLYGPESLMGRGIVVHEGPDDHGEGGTHSSRTTGSAGARIACCVISHCSGDTW